MLKLRIENFDQLADGGPLSHEVNSRGFDIGRDQYLDWTLPDDSRFISGKHCEVRYFDNGYWLYDISTNGTFVNRSSRRVQSPYQLMNGDRLEIGDYVIQVEIAGQAAAQTAGQEDAPAAAPESGSIWGADENAPPPIDRKDLMPPAEKNVRAGGFLDQVASVPEPHVPPAAATPASTPSSVTPVPGKDPWGVTGIDASSVARPAAPVASPAPPPPEPAPAPAAQPPAQPPQPAAPPVNVQGESQDSEPFAFGGNQPGAPAEQVAPQQPPQAAPQPQAQPSAPASDFVRQFAIGANIPPESLEQVNPDELAHELGGLMNIICTQLMQLLSARAAAKSMARSGQRTMIQQTENNPLKFMPSAEEAIRTMLTSQSASYLGARDTMERSFGDLQVHQVATYSAMQHAIRELMDDLSPDSIAKAKGGGKKSLLGGGKGKLWDAYETSWNEKAERYENGMLDAFLVLFSEHYERNSRS